MPINTTPLQPKKLLDQMRDKIRFKHYSLSSEVTYISWIKQFISLVSMHRGETQGLAALRHHCTAARRIPVTTQRAGTREMVGRKALPTLAMSMINF